MKPKTVILMVVAIVCGLGASYMTSRLLAERNTEVPEIPKVSVLVAKQGLSVGQPTKKPEELFEVKEFTKGEEPKEALVSFDQVKNKFLKRNLRKGDFVTPKDIDENQSILPLPPGMVGVGIRVTAESIAGGFAASPGSKVDIVWTLKGGGSVEAQTTTLLENVLVVAADTKNNDGGEKVAIVANVVTVALTQEDAQKVQLAKDHGTLSLNVRGGDDETLKKTPNKLTLGDLLKVVAKDKTNGVLPIQPDPQPQTQPPVIVKAEPTKPVPVVEAPKAAKTKHVVYIKSGGETKTQIFWKDAAGNLLLDGYTTAEGDAGKTDKAPAVNNPPAPPANNPPAVGNNPGNGETPPRPQGN